MAVSLGSMRVVARLLLLVKEAESRAESLSSSHLEGSAWVQSRSFRLFREFRGFWEFREFREFRGFWEFREYVSLGKIKWLYK